MSSSIVFYDLATTEGPRSWSINTLKSRFLLNYKCLPYTTVWLGMKDVRQQLQALGFTPNAEGMPFSVPAIELPNGVKIQDSQLIAQAIEEIHPQPSAHLDSRYVSIAEQAASAIFTASQPMLGPGIFQKHFDEEDRAYFIRDRLVPHGISSLDEISKPTDDPGAWEAIDAALQPVIHALHEQPTGPFFLGTDFSYADVYLSALLFFVRRVDEQVFERLLNRDEVLKAFYSACQPYVQRAD